LPFLQLNYRLSFGSRRVIDRADWPGLAAEAEQNAGIKNALCPLRAAPLNIDFQNTAPGPKITRVGKPELEASSKSHPGLGNLKKYTSSTRSAGAKTRITPGKFPGSAFRTSPFVSLTFTSAQLTACAR
jgi:hypothetical protein